MKTCYKCKKTYSSPLSDYFHKKSGTKDGLQYLCKACVKVAHKKHYKANKQYYIDKAVNRRKTIKEEVDRLAEAWLLEQQDLVDTMIAKVNMLELKVAELEKKVNHE